jgi:hypothetical protein
VTIVSPKGGKCQLDAWSDPRDPSGYSAHDLISMGFMNQFGKPSTPMTVFSARMPTAFTMLAASGGTGKQIKIAICISLEF